MSKTHETRVCIVVSKQNKRVQRTVFVRARVKRSRFCAATWSWNGDLFDLTFSHWNLQHHQEERHFLWTLSLHCYLPLWKQQPTASQLCWSITLLLKCNTLSHHFKRGDTDLLKRIWQFFLSRLLRGWNVCCCSSLIKTVVLLLRGEGRWQSQVNVPLFQSNLTSNFNRTEGQTRHFTSYATRTSAGEKSAKQITSSHPFKRSLPQAPNGLMTFQFLK